MNMLFMLSDIYNIALKNITDITKSQSNNNIIISVSGGVDSMSLMHIVSRLPNDQYSFKVFHFNHRLRETSQEDAILVEKYAAHLHLPFYVFDWKRNFKLKNIMSCAREERYRTIFSLCEELHSNMIFTAHHLDDQVETFLMRLERGSSIDGLSCMNFNHHVNGISIGRPLLNISKKDIHLYAKENGVPWLEDPTNINTHYQRNYIRNIINNSNVDNKDILNKRVFNTTQSFHKIKKAISFYVLHESKKHLQILEGYVIARNTIFSLPEEIYERIILYAIMIIGGHEYKPRLSSFTNLLLILRKYKKPSTLYGCKVIPIKEGIKIIREVSKINDLCLFLKNKESFVLWDKRFDCYSNKYESGTCIKKISKKIVDKNKNEILVPCHIAITMPMLVYPDGTEILPDCITNNSQENFIISFDYFEKLERMLNFIK